MALKHYIKHYKQQKRTSKTCKAKSFQKPQSQSASIFFKFNPSMPLFVFDNCIKLGLIFQCSQKVFKYQADNE